MDRSSTVSRVLNWYAEHQRDLPWRRDDATPWGVMVSEFMLQQTPVARVLGPWHTWMERWPEPADLADAPSGEAIRAWGRLGYPRRALRLHAAATAIRDHHDGEVPSDHHALLALPGVGDYTAAAIASFAFGQRHVVLDTNVRRVLARIDSGIAYPPTAPTKTERELAAEWLPRSASRAATWAVASMELGALVCTARSPDCGACPVQDRCRWFAAGRPDHEGPPRRGQSYEGTDRQCRGALLAPLRDADQALPVEEVLAVWPDRRQAEHALASLINDGLMITEGEESVALPH
ncbi:A/G-specific adenine glycosylase [Propionibacteriaceae bacterium Y1685]